MLNLSSFVQMKSKESSDPTTKYVPCSNNNQSPSPVKSIQPQTQTTPSKHQQLKPSSNNSRTPLKISEYKGRELNSPDQSNLQPSPKQDRNSSVLHTQTPRPKLTNVVKEGYMWIKKSLSFMKVYAVISISMEKQVLQIYADQKTLELQKSIFLDSVTSVIVDDKVDERGLFAFNLVFINHEIRCACDSMQDLASWVDIIQSSLLLERSLPKSTPITNHSTSIPQDFTDTKTEKESRIALEAFQKLSDSMETKSAKFESIIKGLNTAQNNMMAEKSEINTKNTSLSSALVAINDLNSKINSLISDMSLLSTSVTSSLSRIESSSHQFKPLDSDNNKVKEISEFTTDKMDRKSSSMLLDIQDTLEDLKSKVSLISTRTLFPPHSPDKQTPALLCTMNDKLIQLSTAQRNTELTIVSSFKGVMEGIKSKDSTTIEEASKIGKEDQHVTRLLNDVKGCLLDLESRISRHAREGKCEMQGISKRMLEVQTVVQDTLINITNLKQSPKTESETETMKRIESQISIIHDKITTRVMRKSSSSQDVSNKLIEGKLDKLIQDLSGLQDTASLTREKQGSNKPLSQNEDILKIIRLQERGVKREEEMALHLSGIHEMLAKLMSK